MKAVRIHGFGGPEVLRCEEVATPTPGEGEIRLRVHTAGLSYTDLGLRAGRLSGAPPLPFIPGFEAAGVVDAVGPAVRGFAPGDRAVALLPNQGGLAEFAVAPATTVLAIPEAMSFAQAVALPAQAPTALLGLRRAAQLRGGESVFVPSAAGGVGTLLVQLAREMGAGRVIGAASSASKRELVRRLGAATIDPADPEWPARVREATAGQGADVVFVAGDGEAAARSLEALAPRGRLVLFGADTLGTTQWSREQTAGLMIRNQAIVGFATFTLPLAERQAALAEVIALVVRGRVDAVVGQTFALAAVGEAHAAMAARKTTGKVVIHVT
ncbi:NADPH2:quinone reductase [Nannocystis exedens]|uniref:NADPH2:quinone reductase n=1 Tax=Nannocystis exedens TaxID=54 RepID=A0A1I2IQB6_9BACT|nr:zinc-binding dehydrogenase [Nannocystis exedens]PCC74970.1 NADPH:quinone reductase [Nannocystis exedens]SFF43016.1 NADPH2:quinone reductase [Nannocystis exedens]